MGGLVDFFQAANGSDEPIDGEGITLLADVVERVGVEQEGHGFAQGRDVGGGVRIHDVAGGIHGGGDPAVELSVLHSVPNSDQGGEADGHTEFFGRRGGDPGADLQCGFALKPIEECESLLAGKPGDKGVGPELTLANGRGDETSRESGAVPEAGPRVSRLPG